ncbi:MAG: hypothetical protein WD648_03855 [Planctomycetaceae bacterium]
MIAPHSAHYVSPGPLEFIRTALSKHKNKVWICFLATLAVAACAMFITPRTYKSEAKLFVRVGRESVTLDPTATTGPTISYYDSRESEITSVMDVLESHVILEGVVNAVGADKILNKGTNSEKDRERAIEALDKAVSISRSKKSSVVHIACKARTPELAQEIVSTFINVFHEEHLRVNRTAGSHEFFADQSQKLQGELTVARTQLATAKSKVGLVSVEGQRKLLQDQMGVAHDSIAKTSAELAGSEAKIAALKAAIANVPERLTTQEVSGFFDDAAERTRQQLYQHEIHQSELLSKFGANHPQVLTVRDQIAEARRILAEQSESKQATQATNPTYQALHLQLLTEESTAESLKAKLHSLNGQHAQLNLEIAELNNHEGHIAELTNRVALLESDFKAYNQGLEQARIDQALEAHQISNVNIVQPATLVMKPAGAGRAMIAAIGFLVALLNGLGIALISESRRNWSAAPQPSRQETLEISRQQLSPALVK